MVSRSRAAAITMFGLLRIDCTLVVGPSDGAVTDGAVAEVTTTTDACAATGCGVCAVTCAAPANGVATCTGRTCRLRCNAGYVASGATCMPDVALVPRLLAPLSTATVTSRR